MLGVGEARGAPPSRTPGGGVAPRKVSEGMFALEVLYPERKRWVRLCEYETPEDAIAQAWYGHRNHSKGMYRYRVRDDKRRKRFELQPNGAASYAASSSAWDRDGRGPYEHVPKTRKLGRGPARGPWDVKEKGG